MTIRAVYTETSLMGLILLMAGITIRKRRPEIIELARCIVALVTGETHMIASDLERKGIVIEVFIKAIHTIVTIKTGCPIRESMGGHERYIHLTVTSIACIQIKFGDIVCVAIVTGERFSRSRQLVTV